MAQKIFAKKQRMSLVSDERDIMVPAQYYNEVLEWCKKNRINIEAPGGNYTHGAAERIFKVNIWRVKDDRQRMWFVLRWSGL